MDFSIRNATLHDAEAIWRLTTALGYWVAEADSSNWLTDLVTSPQHAVFVAEQNDNRILGWLVVEKRLSLETGFKAEISGLVVAQSARRCGLGAHLVAAAEQWAIVQRLPKMYVRSNIKRIEAHPFYESQGFLVAKTAHQYEKKLLSSHLNGKR